MELGGRRDGECPQVPLNPTDARVLFWDVFFPTAPTAPRRRCPPLFPLVSPPLPPAGNRATGVEYVRGRAPTANAPRLRVSARHEIIVAAGAVMTPKLLLLSGIGDKSQLAEHGIPVQYHNPAVGRSLADGVYAIMQWATTGNTFVRCRLEGERRGPGEAGLDGDETDETVSDASAPAPPKSRGGASLAGLSHAQICDSQRDAYARGDRASTSLGTPGMSAGAFLRSPYTTGGEPDVQLTIHPWDK